MAWDRYLNKETGLEIRAFIGKRFYPKFHCDDPLGGVYVTKAPVAVLKMTPIVQFINTNIAWDVSKSNSATGTINTFDLTFGGGGASDLTGQLWASAPKTGNVQYTTVGTYTATLKCTDTGGNVSQLAKIEINIVNTVGFGKAYIATSDTGLFTYLPGGTPAVSNTGLTGGNLNFASGRINPHFTHLGNAQHHYWACTDNGLVYSTDGGATWNAISAATLGNPTNTAGDASPPTTSDLDQVAVAFDPQDWQRVYCLRVTDSTWNASNPPRAFLYWSDNYGVSWSSVGIGVA